MAYAEYETTFILKSEATSSQIEESIKKMTESVSADGSILKIDHWGARRLAYPIQKQNRGIYVHARYVGGAQVVSNIEQNFRYNEQIIRYLTVKTADDVTLPEQQN